MTVIITKISVNEAMPGLYYITLKLEIVEGVVLYSNNFTVKHRIGNPVADTVNKFKNLMQADIDKYKREIQIFNASSFNTAIITLQGQLVI